MIEAMMDIRRIGLLILALTLCSPFTTASAQDGMEKLPIGYLELANDPRYFVARMDAQYPAQPWGRPYPGAVVALEESAFHGMAAGDEFELRREIAQTPQDLRSALQKMIKDGVQLFLLDLPSEQVATLAEAAQDQNVLLFNVTALSDGLRQQQCQPNLFHLAPSRTMLTDALAQYLIFKKWRSVLVLKGPRPADEDYFQAFQRSARRYGLQVEAVKNFVLGTDPRERGQNNVALLTAGSDADVIMVIDSDGEFARAVPYQTQQPQLVVGAAGLVPDWWHWAWRRHGAPQLNDRFIRATGRLMTGYDWSSWMAVKAIAEAVLRTQSSKLERLRAHLTSEELVLDGFKGYQLNFRPWNNQLRQPIFLATYDWVVARAPLEGFLHQTNNLETLGLDETENECDFDEGLF
jgi:ABC transporter substrate binding protein (PQQ-dependent alcohol dehydrogenase system)